MVAVKAKNSDELSLGIELLDPEIKGVIDKEIALVVNGDMGWFVELSLCRATFTNIEKWFSGIFVENNNLIFFMSQTKMRFSCTATSTGFSNNSLLP